MSAQRKILILVLISSILLAVSLRFAYGQDGNSGKLDQFLNFLKSILGQPPQSSQPKPVAQTPEIFPSVPLYKPILDYERAVTSVVEQASPAVVSIIISKDVPVLEQFYVNPFEQFNLPPEFKDFFQLEVPQLRQKGTEKKKIGGGTGFIISRDGLIVTNKHVVGDKDADYAVFLNDGRKLNGKVVALHPIDDLAVIKIEAKNLPSPTLGNSDNLKLGQTAIAIGNALGEFQNTVSVGVVSGLKRSIVASDGSGNIEKLEGLIQSDAAINPGNSGGPLLNLRGEVIGVNTAIVSGAQNIGFAIPINRVKKMIQDVQVKGKIEVSFLGIRYVIVTEEIQKKFNLPFDYGAYIQAEEGKQAVIANSPAQKAGLREKDLILEIDGEKITQQNTLAQIVTSKNIGQKITLKVWRDGKTLTLEAILEVLPEKF